MVRSDQNMALLKPFWASLPHIHCRLPVRRSLAMPNIYYAARYSMIMMQVMDRVLTMSYGISSAYPWILVFFFSFFF